MDKDAKVLLLKEEYLLLQKFYEDFDTRAITIKGWSATICIAALGVGFYQSHYLWLFASGASLIFWLLEALWKSFQYMYSPRIICLEEAFQRDNFDNIEPLQIYHSWFEAFEKQGFQVLSNARLFVVSFPHFLTVIAGLVLFGLQTWAKIPLSAH